jgi:hypothetical protein
MGKQRIHALLERQSERRSRGDGGRGDKGGGDGGKAPSLHARGMESMDGQEIEAKLRLYTQETPFGYSFGQIPLHQTRVGLLQRKCACGGHDDAEEGGECAECRQKREAGTLQRAASSTEGVSEIPPVVHEVLNERGQPLDNPTRSFMEPRFGYDFSQVRIHTNERAAQSAQAVNALAYTVGSNVVFGQGEYAPKTQEGKRLLAHELTHVVQQQEISTIQEKLALGSPSDQFEQEADAFAAMIMTEPDTRLHPSAVLSSSAAIQRDLATPQPDNPAEQADLTDEQIQAAIRFNRARYDEANTRLIQDLLGGPMTGTWTADNIVAIAAVQEQYGLQKDGMVGFETFRFLNNEQRLEGTPTDTADCLASFLVIGPDAPDFRRTSPTSGFLGGHFRTALEFSSRCNCSQFQYRQFIRGHYQRERGGVVTDMAGDFDSLPAGRLQPGFQEDGDTTDNPVNYGHRDQPADADPEDHYINDRLADEQGGGCRYRNEDFPGGPIDDFQAGDIYDVDISFRGEIQRNGAPIESKFWSAIRGRFTAPP